MVPTDSETAAADRTARIESTVAREMARRQRLLRLYLLLLLVPLGIAGWFVVAGRSDRQDLEKVVDSRVAPVEESYRAIAPKLEQGAAELERVLPEVRQAAAVVAAQRDEIAQLQRGQSDLTARLQTVSVPDHDVAELRQRLDRQDEQLRRIAADQDRISRSVRDLTLRVERQPAGPAASPGDFDKLDARLRALESDVRGLDRRVGKVNPPG